eukprot:5113077-Prymnesium_polylepis.1
MKSVLGVVISWADFTLAIIWGLACSCSSRYDIGDRGQGPGDFSLPLAGVTAVTTAGRTAVGGSLCISIQGSLATLKLHCVTCYEQIRSRYDRRDPPTEIPQVRN